MKCSTFIGVVLSIAPALWGAPVTVSSYTMANGALGSFNYQDTTYLPCLGSVCTTTGAALSGGTGKLTDGVSPATSWNEQGQNTTWVGWDSAQALSNPLVSFLFASVVQINSVTVWVDNTHLGGVALPATVVINGNIFNIADDNVNQGPRGYTFAVNLNTNAVDVQFTQRSGFQWLMVGEVGFDGETGTEIPEPGTWTMMLGSGCLLLWKRLRNG